VGATTGERDLALAYRATNLLVAPQEALRITLRVKAMLLPKQ